MSEPTPLKLHTDCALCTESVHGDAAPNPVMTLDGPHMVHRQCMVREVLGGIGHLVAHDYWCKQQHDPDAGLTRRQSALLVDTWVHVVGTERTEPREEVQHE